MEIIFVAICIAIGVFIPCYMHGIRKSRTALLLSRILLLFAIVLFTASVILFLVPTEPSGIVCGACDVCSGTGTQLSGKLCVSCSGTGDVLLSGTLCRIPLLYPIGLLILSLYTLIFHFALKEIHRELTANDPWFTSRSSNDIPPSPMPGNK